MSTETNNNDFKSKHESIEMALVRNNDDTAGDDDDADADGESKISTILSIRRKDNFIIRLRAALIQVYYEYCSHTSIHGVQYFGDQRSKREKIFWLIVFVGCIYFSTDLIDSIYFKWNDTPVIVSFSEKSTPIWNIPFPAITVCSETKRVLRNEKESSTSSNITYAKFFSQLLEDLYAEREFVLHKNLTENELNDYRTLLQICNTQILREGIPVLSNNDIDYLQILEKMQPVFKRYFYFCKWFSHFGECDELFSRTLTEEGICYTFNGLNTMDLYAENTYQYKQMRNKTNYGGTLFLNRSLEWSLQEGYNPYSGIETYPVRVLGAGARAGLFISLQSFKHEVDYACRGPVQGFKVLLHSPDDVPHVSKEFIRIPMGREVVVAVKPNMITTSAGIAEYDPLRRQCYLLGERNLQFFKVYSQANCELECLANFTLQKCGCVKFSMPRLPATPVCDESKIHCYDRAEDDLLMREFKQGLQHTTFNYRGETECNCMPACTSLVYNIELSQGNFDLHEMLKAAGETEFFNNYPNSTMSRLSIYFKENQFITSKRSELYGLSDFLANCGGIFGLFMGFSFTSVVEIVYHVSLRLWVIMRNGG